MAITFDTGTTKDGANPNDPGSSSASFDVAIFGDDDSPINPITFPSGWVDKSNQYTLGDGGNAVLLGGQSLGTGAALSFQASAAACMVLGSWLGVDPSTPFDVAPTVTLAPAGSGVGAAWAPTAPAITTLTDGCAIGAGIMFDADPPINVTGMTDAGSLWTLVGLINSTAFGGGFANCAMMRLNTNQVTHGTFAAQLFAVTLSTTNTGTWGIFTFALRPAGSALPPFVDVPDVRRVYGFAYKRIQAQDPPTRLAVKPWTQDALIVVPSRAQPAQRRVAQDVPFKGAVAVTLGPIVDVPATRTQPAQRSVAQDVPFSGATSNALGPIVDVPAVRAQPASTRAAFDQVLVTTGTDWTQDTQPLRALSPPVRVPQDVPLPAQQVLPGWAPEGPARRAMLLPARVPQDVPLPAQQVLPGWAPEGPARRAMPLPARFSQDVSLPAQQVLPGWAPEGPLARVLPIAPRLAQDTVLPGFVSAALVSWTPDLPAVRTQQAQRRTPADVPLPARVLPALLGWSPEYPSMHTQSAPRRIAQDVPFSGAAAVALSWMPEPPLRRTMPLPTRLAQDMPISGQSVTWTSEVPPRRAAPAPVRILQDVPLPAPRVAFPWVPDGARMFAQLAPRAVRPDPVVFAPLPLAVVLDVVQMRVQSAARRVPPEVPVLPPFLGLLIAWTPDVYYSRASATSSYYAGDYVLPGLSAMLRPASGPQHRTAYGAPRLRVASEKPRNRTAYGAPRNRIAR